jgi:ribosomal protein S8
MTIEKILTINFLNEKISVDYDFKNTISIYSLDNCNSRNYAPLERIFDKKLNKNNVENEILNLLNKFGYISNYKYKTLNNEIETTFKREIFKTIEGVKNDI